MSSADLIPKDFSGIVRLFPLPDLVMFPHVVQPLRVFEPRYVRMFEEAMASDQLISMALLEPGWEAEYEGRPQIRPIACLGRVISHDKNADGTYNFLLAGLKRVLIVRERDDEHGFRTAEVELVEDSYHDLASPTDERLQEELLISFHMLTPSRSATEESLQKLMQSAVSLGTLADVVAYSAPLAVEQKQNLLEDFDVKRRVETLIEYLHEMVTDQLPSSQDFPPEFSDN